MNYLAHAYLSFNEPSILAGNMISDFVKGKKQYDYPRLITKGIQLHRAIDNFTDSHAAIKEMKKPFSSRYGLYAGAFADIVCDYFLANDRNEFASPEILQSFSRETYQLIDQKLDILPPVFQEYFFYIKQYDWLYNYQYQSNIKKSFSGLARRAKYINETDTAFAIFKDNIENMQPAYEDFFPAIKAYSVHTLHQLINVD